MKLEELRRLVEDGKSTSEESVPEVIKIARNRIKYKRTKKNKIKRNSPTSDSSVILKELRMSFKSEKSNKVYNLRLIRNTDGDYFVISAWGRNGGRLQSSVKYDGNSEEEANKIFRAVSASKLNKGYFVVSNKIFDESGRLQGV